MKSVRRQDVPLVPLPGRVLQRIVGRESMFSSLRMTVATARYSDEAGPMEPHHHAEETIHVLDADRSRVRFGSAPDNLPHIIPLERGLTLHIPELEWHVFEWEPGGFADCLVIYGQVDNIRPEDIARSQARRGAAGMGC